MHVMIDPAATAICSLLKGFLMDVGLDRTYTCQYDE
jgi:hypothetical protein